MPQATFVLKEPNIKEETLVYMLFRFNGCKLKYSTGQKINPKYWNPETQRAREVRGFAYAEFNTLLKRLDTTVSDTYRKLINDNIHPTPEKLKLPLNSLLRKGSNDKKDLINFADDLVENSVRKAGTKKQLKQAIRNLREFKDATGHSLHFDAIDLDFYDSFVNFLIKKNYGTNTIGTLIKNVKVFMNEAVDRKLTTNLQYRNKRFKTVEEHSESIYLSLDDLKRLHDFDFSAKLTFEKVRDLFVIGCFTGLRFSDLSALTDENFIEKKSKIKIKTEKTGELVVIPIHRYVKEVLKKNGNKLPECLSNQKMNQYLKEIGEMAGINEEVLITSTKGGKTVSENFKKYDLITVHTARRSFATNAYLADVPTISIMKITGHKTEKSFLKYIKISQEDNANKLLNHPFFK
jgi:integrase